MRITEILRKCAFFIILYILNIDFRVFLVIFTFSMGKVSRMRRMRDDLNFLFFFCFKNCINNSANNSADGKYDPTGMPIFADKSNN